MRRASPARKQVLLIGGSLNQTTMMHRIGERLAATCECAYSPFYCDQPLRSLQKAGLLEFTIFGGPMRRMTEEYLRSQALPVDEGGVARSYDLVLTCSDLVLPKNVRSRRVVLVQEGMTDPETFAYRLVRRAKLPRWVASTATTGLSLGYEKFCVASEGYREFFAKKGIPKSRMEVTGIPNFDDCASFLENDFPHRGYALVATSDTRETFKRDDRRALIERARVVADGRPLIFKLHPNENHERSTREIRAWAPGALVFTDGNVDHMIANCDVLITQFSSCVFVGLVLGKECHSNFDVAELRKLVPLQNAGASAANIASVCQAFLAEPAAARLSA
jgi:hypothetical protein